MDTALQAERQCDTGCITAYAATAIPHGWLSHHWMSRLTPLLILSAPVHINHSQC